MERWELVLEYWFGSDSDGRDKRRTWFAQNDDVDAEICQQFGRDLELACEGKLDDWAATARGRLGLIIVLDQFARNIHRDKAIAYAYDARAQELALEGIERGLDRRLTPVQRWFFYMPLMHAEDIELQERCMYCFRQLVEDAPEADKQLFQDALKAAKMHRDVIERFGRFPHRNEVLGRASTAAELRHLAHGRFGPREDQ